MSGFWIFLYWNIRKVSLCQGSKYSFLIKKDGSISWNIRNFFWLFQNIRKAYFWENIRSFFRGFCLLRYKKSFLLRNAFGVVFFVFRVWDEKCRFSFTEMKKKVPFWENIRNFFRASLFMKKYKKSFKGKILTTCKLGNCFL